MNARSALGVLPAWPAEPRRDLRLALPAAAAACAAVAFAAATAAGAPAPVLSTVFTMMVPLVAPAGLLAFRRAPADLRPLLGFLIAAAVLWAAGSLEWYSRYAAGAHRVPQAGPWLVPFFLAYVLSMIGLCRAFGRALRARRAALDGSVVAAAGIAFAAALAGHGLRDGVDAQSLATVAQALAGVAVLAVVGSAALGNWQGLRLSVVLFAFAQVCITGGHVVYSYNAVASGTVELRWSELGWFCGVVLCVLAATVIVTGADRPVRLTNGGERPERAPAMLYGVFVALAVTIGVAVYGHLSKQTTVLGIGLATSAWLGAATAFRASGALRDVGRAYTRLDAAHGELARARDGLATANERLLELDRMKDELLASVSHDMRTPLLSISGFAELLHDGDRTDEERRFVAAIDRNARRVLHMVDDLLLAAELRAGGLELELAPANLAASVCDCVDSLRPLAGTRGIDLRTRIEDVPLVAADAQRIEQALDNLLSNALKFTPRGGEVVVSLHADAGRVVVSVADSGVGIARDDRAHVFDAFFRSARPAVRTQPGIGLGLHLVEAIVAAHGGAIEIESEEGRGTTVRLALPVAQVSRAAAR